MSVPSEKELYFMARDRAFTRLVDNRESVVEHVNGFRDGLAFVKGNLSSQVDIALMPKILSESNVGFAIVLGALAKLEAVKGKGYGAVWQQNGTRGVFDNIRRKYNRVELRMELGKSGGGDSLVSDLADLAVYAIKEIVRRAEMTPLEVEKWLEEIRNLS